MTIRNIKRWQWIAASLLVGLVLGYVQKMPVSNWSRTFGDTITAPQFEDGLVREQSGMRWFRNLVVYPDQVDATNQRVYIVAGEFFGGKTEMQAGHRVAIWRPRCFFATDPYQPLTPIAGFKTGQSVLEYLRCVKGTRFSYAWWHDSRWAIGIWTAGSFVIIGLIWPTVINLLVFGSLFRPAEQRGVALVNSAPTPAADSGNQGLALAAVEGMVEKLEAELSSDAVAPASAEPAPPAATTVLSGNDWEPSATTQSEEEKEFGRNKDDFYPTERAKRHSDTQP